MKTRFILLVMSVFMFAACGSDDSAPAKNEIVLEGMPFLVNRVHYTDFESPLTSFSIFDSENSGSHRLSLSFGPITEMPNGTYTLRDIDDPTYDPATNFWQGAFFIGADDPLSITSGTVRFSKVGNDKYKITVNAETTAGTLECTYTGMILQI